MIQHPPRRHHGRGNSKRTIHNILQIYKNPLVFNKKSNRYLRNSFDFQFFATIIPPKRIEQAPIPIVQIQFCLCLFILSSSGLL